MTRLAPTLLLAMTALCCTTGCATILSHDASHDFQRQHSCPGDRLQIKSAHIRLEDFVVPGTPPAEVAADPARLAVWRRNADKDLGTYQHTTAVDVTGCGAHVLYFCWIEDVGQPEDVESCEPAYVDGAHPRFMQMALRPDAGPVVRGLLGLPASPTP